MTERSHVAPGRAVSADEILRRRAARLARPLAAPRQGVSRNLVVEFLLAGERYALDADRIEEVAPIRELVPLPGTPPFVLGIINLRGEMRSVVDLREVFAIPGPHVRERGYMILLCNEAMEFGLFAEEILGADVLRPETLAGTLPTLTDVRAEFLKGVTAQGLVYLDADRLLASPRLALNHDELL